MEKWASAIEGKQAERREELKAMRQQVQAKHALMEAKKQQIAQLQLQLEKYHHKL